MILAPRDTADPCRPMVMVSTSTISGYWHYKDGSELDSGLSMGELLAQIEPNLVGMNRLIGCYARD